ncbi:hypothetical protein [Serratia inhibens]|uniref:hypothetical protein n=1 Tax=Serratia inhibens TaxID=2338073 RepID=UPI00025E2BC5|nr:hypothetical protein [Serratia inhibens]ANS43585.1 hypothetical protein Q5A_015680 [Serratia inhibens PRI-2C]
METVDEIWLDSIAGGRGNNGGDRTDNGGRNKGRSSSNNKSGSGNYYANNTSADCINGMGVGAALGVFGGLPGVAAGLIGGAITGKCFQDTSKGGGNVGMGKGGNKCGSSAGGSCSW